MAGAVVGLLGFPIGTLINGYFLYLLGSRSGATIFTPQYRQVVERTPEIKYKTPIWMWILITLLVLIFVSIFLFAIIDQH